MSYERLVGRVEDASPLTVASLPDGSVDTLYRVEGGGGPVDSRRSFGERVAAGESSSFVRERTAREPGGQATNMAQQCHALGDEVTLLGHLDDPVFESLPFETHSMGDPARVDVYRFDDGDLMLAAVPDSRDGWGTAALDDAAEGASGPVYGADALLVGNWAAFPSMTAVLSALADRVDVGTLLLDPGDVSAIDSGAAQGLCEALASLDEGCEVVVSANREELSGLAAAVDERGGHVTDRVRRAAGVSAVVMHGFDESVAATRDGRHLLPAVDVDEGVRNSGAGDRFSAALARARAAGWDWPVALALGNACAGHYLERGETLRFDGLRNYLNDRGEVDG
ncbi:PfkB family carbohydrate kinase [Halomarina litorea]|uniref:PfkB family carbohydrate kinase n=1 Tax=Halomarina litorea TaxID=2961595 RepID=UPI0020C44549|nr:PfkB family carbohydrate kinase [Halomarina sp. BCD28]